MRIADGGSYSGVAQGGRSIGPTFSDVFASQPKPSPSPAATVLMGTPITNPATKTLPLSRDSRLDQRKLRALLVQGVDGMVDRTIERISVGEGLVCEMV